MYKYPSIQSHGRILQIMKMKKFTGAYETQVNGTIVHKNPSGAECTG